MLKRLQLTRHDLPRRRGSRRRGPTMGAPEIAPDVHAGGFRRRYDLSNEFFRLWLGERMSYTCAVFDEQHTTLEDAQHNKDRILADFAGVTADTLVLDIGCGWGATLEYLARERHVKRAHGITLSRAQHEEVTGASSRVSRRGWSTTRTSCRLRGMARSSRSRWWITSCRRRSSSRGSQWRSTARSSTEWRDGPCRARASASRRSCGTAFRGGARISKTSSSPPTSCFPEA